MLSQERNRRVTRVGPGTPSGGSSIVVLAAQPVSHEPEHGGRQPAEPAGRGEH